MHLVGVGVLDDPLQAFTNLLCTTIGVCILFFVDAQRWLAPGARVVEDADPYIPSRDTALIIITRIAVSGRALS